MVTVTEHRNKFPDKKQALLGDHQNEAFLEHLKLITKEFLYQCQIKENEPIFNNLKQIIKYKIKMEKQHSKLISFERKWNRQLIECLRQ
jgi:hypothetical protein